MSLHFLFRPVPVDKLGQLQFDSMNKLGRFRQRAPVDIPGTWHQPIVKCLEGDLAAEIAHQLLSDLEI